MIGVLDGLMSIVTLWIYCIGFNCIVTCVFTFQVSAVGILFICLFFIRLARMSVLFSIIRLIHSGSRLLKFAYACVAFFVSCWVIIIVEKVWQYASDPSWYQSTVPSSKPLCVIAERIFIFKFTSKR